VAIEGHVRSHDGPRHRLRIASQFSAIEIEVLRQKRLAPDEQKNVGRKEQSGSPVLDEQLVAGLVEGREIDPGRLGLVRLHEEKEAATVRKHVRPAMQDLSRLETRRGPW